MNVIGHEAIADYIQAVLTGLLGEQFQIYPPVESVMIRFKRCGERRGAGCRGGDGRRLCDVLGSGGAKYYDDVGEYDGGPPTHEDLWGKVLKGWRWDYDRGLDWSVFADNLDDGDGDLVRDHLTRKYKIPFYSNGYHDVQFFVKQLEKERAEK